MSSCLRMAAAPSMFMSLAMAARSAIFLSFSALRLRVPGSSGGVASAFVRTAALASPACLSLVLKGGPSPDCGLH